MSTRVVQVALAEPAEVLEREVLQNTRVARIVGIRVAPLQLENDVLEFRKLPGAFDLRMGGQDLLDEGRPGAGQADNENRVAVRRSRTGACGEKLRRTDFDLPARVGLYDFGAITAFGALEGVTALVVLPRARVVAPILQRLAQREAQVI